MSPKRIALVALGSLLVLAGIASFLAPVPHLATLALLMLGAACVVVGAWAMEN